MPVSYVILSFSFYCLAFLLGQFIQHLGLPRLALFLGHPQPILFLGHLRPFHSLGILGPFHFFPILHSHRLLLNLLSSFDSITTSLPLGLLAFEPIPFINSFLWAPPAHFCFLFISHDSHGAYYFILWGFLGLFAFSGATLLFFRPVDHYSCHSDLMVFTLLFSFSHFSY